MSSSAEVAAASILSTMKKLFKMDNATGMASVELWVLMTTLLLVVRFLLDFFGPWHADRAMASTVQIIEMLNYSMVQYTMGLMQLSAKRVNDYFQVWAVLLVTLQYSVKIGRLYTRSKQIPLFVLMSSFWAANLLRIQTFFLLRIPLWLIWTLNAIRIISYFASSERAATINKENTRLVSDYMRYEHTLGHDGDAADPAKEFRMRSYKYLVRGEDLVLHDIQQERRSASGRYRIRLEPDHKKLVTLEKIWNVDDGGSRLLSDTADTGNRLKDVCLSFALYKLLRRRFYDLPIHEAKQEKTRRLVFDYILQNTNNYERAFRVTAVELSFLQDLFYSKHAAMFANGFPVLSILLSLSLVAATGYIAYPVHHIPKRMDQADPNRITHGVFVTRLIVALIIIKEVSEVYLYLFSQWSKVLMICMYVKHQCLRHTMVEAAMRRMFWFIRGKWDQRIFQYNLLISSASFKPTWLRISLCVLQYKRPKSIKLESEVKMAIFESFKSLQQQQERLQSYFSNAFGSNNALMQQLTWAIELKTDTHRILVWHIATCLCEISLSDEATALKVAWIQNKLLVNKSRAPEAVWPHYLIAASLSNYCAYLLTKELVPDNGIVADKVLQEVHWETSFATGSSLNQSLQHVYEKLMKIASKPSKDCDEAAGGEPTEVPKEYEAAASSIINEPVPKREGAIDEEDPKGGGATDEEKLAGDGEINSFITNERVRTGGDANKEVHEGDDELEGSIIQMGAKLGKQLIETYAADRVGLWRDLAEFWTCFLLHLAASTRAAKHKTRLVGKGELITHLWALLSHSGFLGKTSRGQTLLDPIDLDNANPLS